MPNVTFVHANWQTGGVERTNIQWCKVLKLHGIRCTLINVSVTADKTNAPDNTDIFDEVVCCENFAEARDWLHSHFSKDDKVIICQPFLLRKLVGFWRKALRQTPGSCILAIRNSFHQYTGKPVRFVGALAFLFWFMRAGGQAITNSTENATVFPLNKFSRVSVVINPRFDSASDIPVSKWIGKKPKHLVYVGRWDAQKGVDEVHKVATVAQEQGFEFLAFCQKETFPYQRPFLRDVLEHFSTSEAALLFCSKFEGYPNILVEARAMGLPILFSHCPSGTKEILEGYENCVEVKTWAPEEIAGGLQLVLQLRCVPTEYDFVQLHSVRNSTLFKAIYSDATPENAP